jgi:DNA-binding CsgD family transcriptional regulator
MFQLDQTNKLILMHLSEGLTYKEIGLKVFLSYETIKKRLERIKDETGCRNDKALVFHYSDFIRQMREDEQKAA